MNKQTYYLIADIIQRYRTWIIVKDTELLVEMRILHDGVLKPLFYKGLSLQSYRDHYSFRKKRKCSIIFRKNSSLFLSTSIRTPIMPNMS